MEKTNANLRPVDVQAAEYVIWWATQNATYKAIDAAIDRSAWQATYLEVREAAWSVWQADQVIAQETWRAIKLAKSDA